MASTRLAPSLLLWINSFTSLPSLAELDPISGNPKRSVNSLADLNDGVVLGDVVGEIDPQYFRTLSTLATNQRSLAENWIIRFNSLKRLYKLLIRYFEDVLHTSTTQLVVPNLQLIAKGTEGSEEEICKLAGIILALVVQSEQRELHVARIQKLETWAQRELMWSIEQVMSKVNSKVDLRKDAARESGEEADSEFYELQNERSQIINEKDVLQGVYEELMKNFDTLKGDHEDVVRQLAFAEARNLKAVEEVKAGNVDKAAAIFKVELDRVKSELAKVENVLAESEVLVESQSRSIEELTRSVEDLTPRAEEAAKLKDQMDEYRHAAEKAKKTENVIEKYKKKLEESADLRRNIKALEDQNSDLLDKNVALEEEFATVSALKPLVESYKSQLLTLESKTSTLSRDNETLRYEVTRSKEKLKVVEAERKKENESLVLFEERVKELEFANTNRRRSKNGEDDGEGEDLEDAMMGTTMTDLKLQVRKLKRELESVKGNSASNSKVVVLENLLEDSNRMKGRYEGDYLKEHRENLVLKSRLEEIMSGKSRLGDGPEATIALRQRLNEIVEELDTLRKKSIALEVKFESQDEELTIAKSDLTLVNKDQLDILQSLKASVSIEKDSLKVETERLKTSLQSAEDRIQMHLSQVNILLMEKVSLQNDGIDQRDRMLEKERDLGNLKVSHGQSGAEFTALKEENAKNASDVTKYRLKLEKAKEFIKMQDDKFQSARIAEANGNFEEAEQSYLSQISTLKEELDRQKSNNADVEAQYRREQQLMLSAWHDIGMRTMRESVSTGGAPKNASWMAKERVRSNGSGLRYA